MATQRLREPRYTPNDIAKKEFLLMCYNKAQEAYDMAEAHGLPHGDLESDGFLNAGFPIQITLIRNFLVLIDDDGNELISNELLAQYCPILAKHVALFAGYGAMSVNHLIPYIIEIVWLNQEALTELLRCDMYRHANSHMIEPHVAPIEVRLRDEMEPVREFRREPYDESLRRVVLFLKYLDDDDSGSISSTELIDANFALTASNLEALHHIEHFDVAIDALAPMIHDQIMMNDSVAVELLQSELYQLANSRDDERTDDLDMIVEEDAEVEGEVEMPRDFDAGLETIPQIEEALSRLREQGKMHDRHLQTLKNAALQTAIDERGMVEQIRVLESEMRDTNPMSTDYGTRSSLLDDIKAHIEADAPQQQQHAMQTMLEKRRRLRERLAQIQEDASLQEYERACRQYDQKQRAWDALDESTRVRQLRLSKLSKEEDPRGEKPDKPKTVDLLDNLKREFSMQLDAMGKHRCQDAHGTHDDYRTQFVIELVKRVLRSVGAKGEYDGMTMIEQVGAMLVDTCPSDQSCRVEDSVEKVIGVMRKLIATTKALNVTIQRAQETIQRRLEVNAAEAEMELDDPEREKQREIQTEIRRKAIETTNNAQREKQLAIKMAIDELIPPGDEMVVEDADAVIFTEPDGTEVVECRHCFGYNAVVLLRHKLESDRESGESLSYACDLRLENREYQGSSTIPNETLLELVPEGVRKLLRRGQAFFLYEYTRRAREIVAHSSEIREMHNTASIIADQLDDAASENDRIQQQIENMERRLERKIQAELDAARRAENARQAAELERLRREAAAERAAEEAARTAFLAREQAKRDETNATFLADGLRLEGTCRLCGIGWIWDQACATIKCPFCKAAGRDYAYCAYCNEGPFPYSDMDVNREVHGHIQHCRFNVSPGTITPNEKQKEAIVRIHIRNAVAYIIAQRDSGRYNDAVLRLLVSKLRQRFSAAHGAYSDRQFLSRLEWGVRDELYHINDFTEWFDVECRERNVNVRRVGGVGGLRRNSKSPSSRGSPAKSKSPSSRGSPAKKSKSPSSRGSRKVAKSKSPKSAVHSRNGLARNGIHK
jgi:rubrerythrin